MNTLKLKRTIPVEFVVYCIIIIVSYWVSLYISEDQFLPVSTASKILDTLIDVNIALVAFWGLILVYLLNYLRSAKQRVAREKHELQIERDKLELERVIQYASGRSVARLPETFDEIAKKFDKSIKELDKELKNLADKTSVTNFGAFLTVIYLLCSIFLSIIGLGKITNDGLHFSYVFYSLLFMFLAVFSIFARIWYTRPRYELESLKEDWRKASQESKK